MLYRMNQNSTHHDLNIFDQYSFPEYFLQNQLFKIFEEIAEVSHDYEGNWGKNLEEIIEDLSFCYYCMKYQRDISEGICPHCGLS